MRQIQRFACVAITALLVAGVSGAQQKAPAKAKAGGQDATKPKAAVAAPKIEVLPETKDAGVVAKGQVIETTFLVKNNGGSDLIISDARPGCGCTVASFDKVIKPGAEGKVVTSVAPPLAYIIPPQYKDVIDVLKLHGIRFTRLAKGREI